MQQQVLLDLFEQECEFDNFICLSNELAFHSLVNYTNQYTHIFGAQHTGKTHLLKAWVNKANKLYNSAIYITAQDLSSFSIYDIDLNTYQYIAIDDIDYVDDSIQDSLFKLYNRIKLNNLSTALLTSSVHNLNQLDLREDLKTRLHWGVVFQLKTLSDDTLMQALINYAKKVGIIVDTAALNYLLKHTNRNLGEVINLLHRISLYSATYKKNLSIHTIKQVLDTL